MIEGLIAVSPLILAVFIIGAYTAPIIAFTPLLGAGATLLCQRLLKG